MSTYWERREDALRVGPDAPWSMVVRVATGRRRAQAIAAFGLPEDATDEQIVGALREAHKRATGAYPSTAASRAITTEAALRGLKQYREKSEREKRGPR
jgi:hypothetical protein